MCLYLLLCFTLVFGYNVPHPGLAPLVKLNDGNDMPRFGLGTWLGFEKMPRERWVHQLNCNVRLLTPMGYRRDAEFIRPNKSPEVEVRYAVEAAIDAGYRHIDTASIYNTEEQIGLAMNNKINERIVNREDMFITTKLWNDAHPRDSVVPALKDSLNKLNLDYIDLYLIHFPVAAYTNGSIQDTDYLETWQGMIDARKLGLTTSIGVSNFNISQMQRLIDNSGIAPAVLQIEINLNLQQPSVIEFCKTNNITVMGFTPFGSIFAEEATTDTPAPRVDDENLVNIANKYNKTVPQVVLRYLFELELTPIPKSVHKERVEQNIDIFDFELTQEDRDILKSYDVNYRTLDFLFWKNSPYYPF